MDVLTSEVTAPKPEARPKVPNPKPIDTTEPKFKVLTRKTLPEGEFVYYGLSVQDYEVLARSMSDILRWVKEAEWRLRYYRGEGELDGVSSGQPQP